MEGVFPPQRSTHPFRIIEHDAISMHSMTSLGRVGRILGGSVDVSNSSTDKEINQNSMILTSSTSVAVPVATSSAVVAVAVDSLTVAEAISAERTSVADDSPPDEPVSLHEPAQASNNETPTSTVTLQGKVFEHPDEGTHHQMIAAAAHLHLYFTYAHCTNTLMLVDFSCLRTSAWHAICHLPLQLAHNTQSFSQLFALRKTHYSQWSLAFMCNRYFNLNSILIITEPDVIASTKLTHSKTVENVASSGPVAPPRRKKKARKLSNSSSDQISCSDSLLNSVENRAKLSVFVPPPNSDRMTPEENRSLPSPATAAIQSLTREIENSFAEPIGKNRTIATGSSTIGRCQSLGNSSTSVYSKPSPSNSSKSNSAPGRVSSIDPSQGLNLYKATRGQYVVKPQDEEANKAEGPSKEEIERIEKIRAEIFGSTATQRLSLAGTGTNSLGNGTRYGSNLARAVSARERRKSAGDEDALKHLHVYVRTRTDSGNRLTDLEILEQVPVKNLDTGEKIMLSEMKSPPPPDGWNPLSLHIHKLTSHLEALQKESDEESVIGVPPGAEVPQMDEEEGESEESGRLKRKTARLKRFFGSTMRKTVDKAKSIASEVSHARHKEDVADIVDVVNPEQNIKIKASSTNKGPYEFTKLQHVQDLSGEHTGAVWCMKFSSCGRLLATAGQDRVLRIWVLKDAYPFFQDMRTKFNADQKSSPTPSQESLVSHNSAEEAVAMATAAEQSSGPFMPKAFCSYTGHTSGKSFFINHNREHNNKKSHHTIWYSYRPS